MYLLVSVFTVYNAVTADVAGLHAGLVFFLVLLVFLLAFLVVLLVFLELFLVLLLVFLEVSLVVLLVTWSSSRCWCWSS